MGATPGSEAIIELVRRASRTTGPDADFAAADLDRLIAARGSDRRVATERLLVDAFDALALEAEASAAVARSRAWAQLSNRIGSLLSDAYRDDAAALVPVVDRALRVLAGAPDLDPSVVGDLKASLAASIAWALLACADGQACPCFTDRAFDDLVTLYGHRFRFDTTSILAQLAGHPDLDRDPVLGGFAIFAAAVLGDWDGLRQHLGLLPRVAQDLPLAAAKLVAYSLHAGRLSSAVISMPLGEGTVRDAFERAVDVWYAHGGDAQCFVARAELCAIVDDRAGVNDAIDGYLAAVQASGAADPDTFLAATRLRSDLLDRIEISRELARVRDIRSDADHALAVARETSTQVPTVVGLFTAVIALVVGSAQVADGLDAQERILVVGALGTVLLGFIVAIAGLARLVSARQTSLPRILLFVVGAASTTSAILFALYRAGG